MKTVYSLEEVNHQPSVVTIGVFDGVHLGHRAIMRAVKTEACKSRVRSVVVTFAIDPDEYRHPAASVRCITTHRQKLDLIAAQGIDLTVVLPVEPAVMEMPAREFVSEILCDTLRVLSVVVGTSFAFGKNRSGTVPLLQRMGRELGFGVIPMPPVRSGETVVSSTAVRHLLADGRIETANEFLGRPFVLEGKVVSGKGIGRQMGYPTANVEPGPKQIVPGRGVYAVSLTMGETQYVGVTNIGVRPTLDEGDLTVEVYIIGFAGDLHGRDIELSFHHRLRGEQRFPTLDALKAQIARDAEQASKLLG